MKILVAVKRVPDPYMKIRLKSDGSAVETANQKMVMNPFDEIAVEEAVRLKEQGIASEVVVVTIGDDLAQDVLRHALAMGACRALLVRAPVGVEPLVAAKVLKALVLRETPQLVMLGKQAVDSDNNQVGQMLAGLLNWPQGTFASKLVFSDSSVQVTRELDGGLETISMKLPAVITTDLRLNTPRYIALPNIVKAKQKPLLQLSIDELGVVSQDPRYKVLSVSIPQKVRVLKKMDSVEALIQGLKEEGVLS